MKLLRRNEQSSGRGSFSNNAAEIRHMKALSLIEELDERMKRSPLMDERDAHNSERHSLHPKRLLCFSNKVKKDDGRDKSPWRSRSVIDSTFSRKHGKINRKNGDLSELCNELCQDYYEIREKLRKRPVARTPKKTHILDAIAVSNSTTSSSIDAPLRNFDKGVKKKTTSRIHYSNESRELHRRQRSLMDDNASAQSEQIKSKSSKSNSNKPNRNIFTTRKASYSKSKSSGSKQSNRCESSKSRSHGSSSRKPKSNRPHGEKQIPRTSTDEPAPVSVVQRKIPRNGIQSGGSMISTMTSRSYTTCDDSSIILSPRGAKEKVEKYSEPGRVNLSLGCSPVTPCASRRQKSRQRLSRNPSNSGVSPSDLGVITEVDGYSSSSPSSASYSSYGSSSSGSYSDYSDSGSESEYDDPSLFYESSHMS